MTAQLVTRRTGRGGRLESTLRFLLLPVGVRGGAVVRISPRPAPAPPVDWNRPLDGKVALVTGAARGIGAATPRCWRGTAPT